jgi:ribosomal protein L40E
MAQSKPRRLADDGELQASEDEVRETTDDKNDVCRQCSTANPSYADYCYACGKRLSYPHKQKNSPQSLGAVVHPFIDSVLAMPSLAVLADVLTGLLLYGILSNVLSWAHNANFQSGNGLPFLWQHGYILFILAASTAVTIIRHRARRIVQLPTLGADLATLILLTALVSNPMRWGLVGTGAILLTWVVVEAIRVVANRQRSLQSSTLDIAIVLLVAFAGREVYNLSQLLPLLGLWLLLELAHNVARYYRHTQKALPVTGE